MLTQWAMEKDTAAVPVESVLSLLLAPIREASPAAPWEYIAQLASAPLAERYALAIGVTRLLNDPADMISRIEKVGDSHCRKKIKRVCAPAGIVSHGLV